MSGKAYTMKEMKTIVEYLTEHKAYNEIKAKKMWVDFERSKVLDRTWQSLKETFLKRILPDIHNPYYQLSPTQISSFRNGYDVEAKLNNKLEIRTVNEESNTNIEQAISEHPSTSNGNASGKKSGEDTINTKTVTQDRSSAETVVIDTCYDTAEDIQKELEGNDYDQKNNSSQPTQKSLRDFITYSEPLTPMLQEVIDDFATDEESDSGTRMEIVEDANTEEKSKDPNNQSTEGPIEINSDSELDSTQRKLQNKSNNTENHKENEVATENIEQSKIGQVTETSVQEISSTEDIINVQSSNEVASKQVPVIDTDITKEVATSNNKDENITTNFEQNKSAESNNSEAIATQNTTTNTSDSLIPNNQEALKTQFKLLSQTKNKTSINENETPSDISEKVKEAQSKTNDSNKRKRATSQDPTVPKEKRRLMRNSKQVSMSDTDAGKQNEKHNIKSNLPESHLKPKAKKLKTSDIDNRDESIKNITELENVSEINEEVLNTSENITKIQNDDTRNITQEIENPCLKSVSLYDEQFTTTKYSESSDAAVPEVNKNQQKEKNNDINKNNSDNDTLKSHSDSHSEKEQNKRKSPPVRTVPTKSEREKVLANIFGFSSGAMTHSRKRRVSYRKSASRHSRTRLLSSGSSEWTSESDAEYVSPPRGRKDRHSKKYLKPKSARIFSLEEEGGLFVMYGKKIYPVVKDGKLVKNYVTYAPERESDGEDDSYWKHKYMEEKKRTAQLTKLLHQSEDNKEPSNDRCPEIDLTRVSPPKKQRISLPQIETKSENSATPANTPNKPLPEAKKEPVPTEPAVQNKTVKIKITKQNEEVELEGHWSQLHPVLDHVVQIFHKEVEPKLDSKSLAPSESKVCLSGLSTPIIPHIDQVAHEKVRKLETEIFQEIVARDKQNDRNMSDSQSISTDSSKVTKRRGPSKRSKSSIPSAPTTPEVDKNELNSPNKIHKERNVEKSAAGDVENETSPPTVRRITRTSKNALHENTDKNESKISTRTKKTKSPAADEEADVRYKLPSSPPSTKKTTRSAAKMKLTKTKNRYVKKSAAVSTLDVGILNTIESSQGYLDSDISPPRVLRKRKLRKNMLSGKVKQLSRQNIRRRNQLNYYEMSDQSSNSCPNFGLISKTIKEGFSSNSDIYRSESLQLLMPRAKTTIGINPKSEVFTAFSEQLDRIINAGNIEPHSTNKDSLTATNVSNDNCSSNVSLPPSPVLSIVENLSIDKNSLKSFFDDNIAIDQQIEECNNDFLITNEDVTMLLMEDCENQVTTINNAVQNNNENNQMVTESILSKLGTVNLNQNNTTISDSLHQKISNMILESAKKSQPVPQIIEPRESEEMDIDTNVKDNKNTRSNKRCSTPLKRQVNKRTKKKKPLDVFIEEEHTDSCSQSARKSFTSLTRDPSSVENLNPDTTTPAKKTRNSRGRKKKEDIIKVKILRPKARSHSREILTEQTKDNRETKSIHGDSGINETESSILHQQLDRSVDLIHNHSETCLQTDECLDNSVEYIESHRSLICLLTDSDHSSNIEYKSQSGIDCNKNTQCELLNKDTAAKILCNVIQTTPASNSEAYHPMLRDSPDSLITEDLSEPEQDQITDRVSKWYLFSEDENTNITIPQSLDFRSDLDKLFPVACAVPNLSTITEMSKENDNKPVDPDGDTRNDLLSQSLFDSNF